MGGYKLRSDETKILTCTQVRRCGDDREQACVELTLTNRNLIYVWQIRKMFGKGTEHEDVYPLSRLKVLDGVAQAKYAEKNDLAVLDLLFVPDEVSFVFETGDKYSSRKLMANGWMPSAKSLQDFRPARLRNCARPYPVWRCWRGPSKGPLMFSPKRLPERRWIRRKTQKNRSRSNASDVGRLSPGILA